MANKKKTPKIVLAVVVTVLVVGALFILKAYLGGKFGIFAEVTSQEKMLLNKTVANNGFANATITNLQKDGTVYDLKKTSNIVGGNICGAGGGSLANSHEVCFQNGSAAITAYNADESSPKIYVGKTEQITSGQTISLAKEDAETTTNLDGLVIKRGNGWLYVQYAPSSGTKTLTGRIAFQNVKLTSASLVNPSLFGLELTGANGSTTSDQVSVSPGNGTVDFVLKTNATDFDSFYINYCCMESAGTQTEPLSGSIAEDKIDLGKSYKISRVGVGAEADGTCTNFYLKFNLSADGVNWSSDYTTLSSQNEYVFPTPLLARYVKYFVGASRCQTTVSPEVSGFWVLGYDALASVTSTTTATGTAGCVNQCGNGICEEVVCEAVGCPCAESIRSCPADCSSATASTTPPIPPTPTSTPANPPIPATPTPASPITPTITAAATEVPSDIFTTPKESVQETIVSGIQSGSSFWLLVGAVALIGGLIIYRIIKS